MENLKILSLFSGIGAFEKALERQSINYELINYCEIDKYASSAYSLIHNVDKRMNLGDITKVDETKLNDFDLMTWGFPCTDISVAGKQKGFIDESGNKTRSGLYYDGLRILKYKKPKYSIIENVKALTQKKFKPEFDQILKDLEELGYNNYYKVLNAKDFGIPQNRERVFIISIRKDIDDGSFEFPIGFDNGIRLKDVLENKVDNKYYLSEEVQQRFVNTYTNKNIVGTTRPAFRTIGQRDLVYNTEGIVATLVATDYKQPKQILVGNTHPSGKGMNGCVYDVEGIAPTITTNKGEGNKILQVGNIVDTGNFENPQRGRIYSSDDISPALTTCSGGGLEPKILEENELKFVGGIETTDKWVENDQILSRNYKEGYRVYDSEGIACCQKTNGGGIGSHTGLYQVYANSKKGFVEEASKQFIDINGYIPDNEQVRRVYNSEGLRYFKDNSCGSQRTINSSGNKRVVEDNTCKELYNINPSNQGMSGRIYDSNYIAPTLDTTIKKCLDSDFKIRKLTPLECLRLMGFDDHDYYILKENNISDTQMYKMAGNSIVVSVLEKIFKNLFKI